MIACILAGGSGMRLWPMSTRSMPKQFLRIVNSKSFLKTTFERISNIVLEEDIYIIGKDYQLDLVKHDIPNISSENWLGEPQAKNTAPAIGFFAAKMFKKNPKEIICVLPSDQIISDSDSFVKALASARDTVLSNMDSVVLIGAAPNTLHTGYGYIQYIDDNHSIAKKVSAFVEKPGDDMAAKFISEGNYLWNCGVFVWTAETILRLFCEYAPDIYSLMMDYIDVIGQPDEDIVLNQLYSKVRSISVDYAIIEKAKNIFVVPTFSDWSDGGSWQDIYNITEKDRDGNVFIGDVTAIDTVGCLVRSDKSVALFGVSDLVVVSDDNYILVMHKDRAQQLESIVKLVNEKDKQQ